MSAPGSDEITKAAAAVSEHIPDVLEKSFMWLAGLATAFGVGKNIVKQGSKATTEFMVDQSVRNQIGALEETIQAQTDRIRTMGKALDEIRAIEMEGAADIAVMGVYLNELKSRKCPGLVDGSCPAISICTNIDTIYRNINMRRLRKALILAGGTDETTA